VAKHRSSNGRTAINVLRGAPNRVGRLEPNATAKGQLSIEAASQSIQMAMEAPQGGQQIAPSQRQTQRAAMP